MRRFLLSQSIALVVVCIGHIYVNRFFITAFIKSWFLAAGRYELITAIILGIVIWRIWMWIEKKAKTAPPALEWRRATRKTEN